MEEEHVLKVAQEDQPSKVRGRGAFKGGHGRGRRTQTLNKFTIEFQMSYTMTFII